jgi:UDP-N-acetylmuramoyl-tripeptide--D-alanyl-D-alanine ligase
MTENNTVLFTLGEIGEILGSNSEGDPGFHRSPINGISTDSRTIKPGELFIAIIGPKHNGHDHIQTAFSNGAVAAVVSKSEATRRNLTGQEYIKVPDTLTALGDLAKRYRQKMPVRVFGVTGSNGKTTVKNMIHDIISSQGPALKSQGNFNNLIGLPLSIFQLRPEHKNAVFELGMSARGEILRLSEITAPDFAVINNVGPVHLEFLKNVDEVAEAKLEIVSHLKSSGTLAINGDDEILARKLGKVRQRIIRFGLGQNNDIRATGLEFDDDQMPNFQVGNHSIELHLPGIHNVYNALAAYAIAIAAGIDSSHAIKAINLFYPQGMRSEIIHHGGLTFLIDCYNANPTSTKYALETLSRMRCGGRRVAVLGDMLELGENSREFHEEIGDIARALKIDNIFGFGPLTIYATEHFGEGAFHFSEKEGLIKKLEETLGNGDVVLFKGSRGMVLEEVVDRLKNSL